MRVSSLRAVALRGSVVAKRAMAGLVACAILAFGAAPASAQSYVCNDLAAKLAAVSRLPASNTDRWAAAIVEQREAMASNRAAQARCGAPSDPRCAAMIQRGQQMAANLANLERQHAQMGGASAPPSEATRIRTLMTQLRCGEKQAPGAPPVTASFDSTRSRVTINGVTPGQPGVTYRVATPGETPPGVGTPPPPRPRENRSLFGMLFGGGNAAGDPEPDDQGEQVIDPATAQMLSGNYRTLCVRTCDGYFFPISFSASQGRLRTDANVCKALCPAAETRLFYHRNPGEEAEQAVAADGTRDLLSRLPNAFRYRTEVVPGCTCGTPDPRLLPPGAGGLKGTRDALRSLQAEELPLPRANPGADADPETQAVTVAGLIVEPVSPASPEEAVTEAATPAGAAAPSAPPKVRIVGPKYFADR